MFTRTPTLKLQVELDKALIALALHKTTSAEYAKIMDHIVTLHRLKEEELPDRVSYNTLAMIAANLLGIVMIVRHEHLNVITTKALSMLPKIR